MVQSSLIMLFELIEILTWKNTFTYPVQVFDETTCECARLIFRFFSQYLMYMAEILPADRITQGLSVV